ncbi:MAG: nitronate monooxygenase [Candidatus Obscuribacterales bacterium]|nr:nitronate monooxygenase [Candidatus Obscuribacterales bacterium]
MPVDGKNNWAKTRITELLKIQYPIFQGPFGRGGSTPLLAATVSNAGGLGGYGGNDLSPEELTSVISEIRALTDKPFNINLWVSTFDEGGERLDASKHRPLIELLTPYYRELGVEPAVFADSTPYAPRNFEEQVDALIEAKPAVFSFVFGVPSDEILRRCRSEGILTAGAASTVDEAKLLEEAGVDIVVASGFEAGGHHSAFLRSEEESQIGTFALVPQIADAVKVPVVAAGGIADGRGIAAALTLGADAAQIGTAFLACDESGATDAHRQLLFKENARTTVLTRAFTGRLARGVHNKFASEMKRHEKEFAPYPAHNWIIAPLRAAALAQGRLDLVGLWAGQAARLSRHHKTDELFAALVQDTNKIYENRTL